MQLVFCGPLDVFSGYKYSDLAGDLTNRRSTSGFLFNIGRGAISWSSKQQPTVALSFCEAEYVAQTQAAKETIWLRSLLVELLNKNGEVTATVIYGDNQGAIALAKNPQFHKAYRYPIPFCSRKNKPKDKSAFSIFPPKNKSRMDLLRLCPRIALLLLEKLWDLKIWKPRLRSKGREKATA